MTARLQVAIVRIGDLETCLGMRAVAAPDGHQFVGRGVRQRTQKDAANDREKRGVCANAQRERHDRCRTQPTILAQDARGKSQVAPEDFDGPAAAHVAPFVLKQNDVAKLTLRAR